MSGLQAERPPLLLASQSAARRTLLAQAGLRFAAVPARVDEAALQEAARAEGLRPAETALLLADAKAARVSAGHPQAVVLGADQLLVCEGEWFDKPDGPAQAREQLRRLRGRTHELVTAVVAWQAGERLWHHLAAPRVTLRDFSDAVLDAHLLLEGEAVLESVGAYRIEGAGALLLARTEGEHSAILGLPLLPVLDWLRSYGVLLR